MRLLHQMLTPLGRAIKTGLSYILRDEFTTDAPAPLASPRTCEPGPGAFTVVDTGNKMSIASSKLHFTATNPLSWTAEGIYDTSEILRAVGLFIKADYYKYAGGGHSAPLCLFAPQAFETPASAKDKYGFYDANGLLRLYVNGQAGSGATTGFTFANTTTYTLAFVLRSTGCFYFIKGGTFTDWTLLFVSSLDSTSSLYPLLSDYSAVADIDNLLCYQLGSPFTDESGWRTSQLLNPVLGSTTTHATNGVLDITFIYDTTLMTVDFRKQDSTHYWQLYVSSSGVYLRERNGGSFVNRGTYSWSAPTSGSIVKVVLHFDSNVYRGYVRHPTLVTTGCWQYTDSSNLFLTSTAAEVSAISGGVSELNFWPAHPTGLP